MLTTLIFALEIKFVLKIESDEWGINRFFTIKQIDMQALTVLCFTVKHLRSGYSTQEVGRNT